VNGTPFSSSPLHSPLAQRGTGPAPSPIVDAFGNIMPATNDPAWQPPRDPLTTADPRAMAAVIYREIPNLVIQTGWTIANVRAAVESLVIGLFDAPSQLVDAVMSDSRVASAMASRSGGLLGRSITFRVPPHLQGDAKAEACCEAWQRIWPSLGTEPALSNLQTWGATLGFQTAQLLWDTSADIWCPYLEPWHARYTYYHWIFRRYIAITLDGQVPIEPGNGHWVLHAPHGAYRGWMRGAIRAVAPWWLARNYALRDWARYSERHGMPILLAKTPFGADVTQIQNFRAQLSQLGQESVLQIPQSADPQIGGYDLDFLEASDQAWLSFPGLITQCNAEITLSLLGQNLTTEVKEGSYAAARVHADVRQAILEADARALEQTIYTQIARPFAAINFGDPALAPYTAWDVTPEEDRLQSAQTLKAFAEAVAALRAAGEVVDVERLAAAYRVPLKRPADVRADAAPIYAYHMTAGVVTANEVRGRLGLDDIEGGDELLAPPTSGGGDAP
jgi:phage gp29-like protein